MIADLFLNILTVAITGLGNLFPTATQNDVLSSTATTALQTFTQYAINVKYLLPMSEELFNCCLTGLIIFGIVMTAQLLFVIPVHVIANRKILGPIRLPHP